MGIDYRCKGADMPLLHQLLDQGPWPHSRKEMPLSLTLGGDRVLLREVVPGDKGRLVQAFHDLSERSVYLRFMRAKQPPSQEQVAWFTDYPRDTQLSLLLCDDKGYPVAQAQSIRRRRHPLRAEFSCVVADHFQRRGAARHILLALALLARGEGVREWMAEILAENRPMLALVQRLGLPVSLVTGRAMVFVRLDLTALDPWLAHQTKGE